MAEDAGGDMSDEVMRLEKEIKKLDKKIKEIKALKERVKEDAEFKPNPDQNKKIKSLKKLQDECNLAKLERDRVVKGGRPKKEKEKEAASPPPPAAAAAEPAAPEPADDGKPKVDRTNLTRMIKEYDSINDLRMKIARGKIQKPTPQQLVRIKQADMLQKAIAVEEARIAAEEDKLAGGAGTNGTAGAGAPIDRAQIAEVEARKADAVRDDDLEMAVRLKKEAAVLRERYAAQLEEKKKEATAADDLELALRLKKEIEDVRSGEPIKLEADEGGMNGTAAEAADSPKSAARSPDASPGAAPEASPEASPAGSPAGSPKAASPAAGSPAASPEAAPQADAEEEVEMTFDEEEEAAAEPEPEPAAAEEPEEVAEPEPEPEPEPVPPPRPKTAEELGMTFVRHEKKEDDTPAPLEGQTFEDLVRSAKSKRVTRPYTVSLEGSPEPKRGERPKQRGGGLAAKQALARLMKDYADFQRNPIYNVAAEPLSEDDMMCFHVNVSPTEGPYAGLLVHFVVYFPDVYPLEPPSVRCCSNVSHPSIVDTPRFTAEVCLHVNDHKAEPSRQNGHRGWIPSYGLHTILVHLSTLFDQAYVDEVAVKYRERGGRGGERQFKDLLAHDRLKVQDYEDKTTGHCVRTPVPALPSFNGPFDEQLPYYDGKEGAKGPLIVNERGAVWARSDCRRAGHYWLHNFTKSGKHYFRAVLCERAEGEKHADAYGWRFGWSGADGLVGDLGEDADSWSYAAVDGQLRHGDDCVDAGVKASAGDVVDCFLDLDAGEMTWAVNGTELPEKLTGIDASKAYHPSFCFGGGYGAELVFVANAGLLPPAKLPRAVVPSEEDDSVRCFVTKQDSGEAVLGMGIRVERKGPAVSRILPEPGVLSHDAFTACNVRKSEAGAQLTHLWPLMLDRHHAVKARPLLEKGIAEMLRNPAATSLYKPPFKPPTANRVLPLLMDGCVDFVLRGKRSAPISCFRQREGLRMYTHAVHAYRTLAGARDVIAADAGKIVESFLADADSDVQGWEAVAVSSVADVDAAKVCDTAARRAAARAAAEKADDGKAGHVLDALRRVGVHSVLRRLLSGVSAEELAERGGAATDEQYAKFHEAVAALHKAREASEVQAAAGIEPFDVEAAA
eukprot:TRINITY_DN927_c0_g2_i1.p1 TRINITY_DN927_c0_g2~~TRINITY_DN927_c0_g2_i1.p1  ORF type:complete len:1125 (+),score=547.71 TRINITY_DN927_c0_g2_i1:83-3457(+)